jgi:hypothetical protein
MDATLSAPENPRPTVEAISRARAFRHAVEIEDAEWLQFIRTALRPVNARRKRYPNRPLRTELLDTLAVQWRTRAPQRFRISFSAQIDHARAVLRERRLGIGRLDATDLAEPGCSVVEMMFVADRDGVRRPTRILAVFSLHAIATKFARGSAIDDATIIADMGMVSDIDLDRLGPAGGGVRVGHWRGRMATIADADGGRRRIVAVHTWLPA